MNHGWPNSHVDQWHGCPDMLMRCHRRCLPSSLLIPFRVGSSNTAGHAARFVCFCQSWMQACGRKTPPRQSWMWARVSVEPRVFRHPPSQTKRTETLHLACTTRQGRCISRPAKVDLEQLHASFLARRWLTPDPASGKRCHSRLGPPRLRHVSSVVHWKIQ